MFVKRFQIYDNGFDIMFVRMMKEISMGMHTLNITMTYRKDISHLFRELTNLTQTYYERCTQYLLEKGLLPRSPYVAIDPKVEFVKQSNYLGGINPLTEKRPLNTVEIAHLYHAIESNALGVQMIKSDLHNVPKITRFRSIFKKAENLQKESLKN
jgi:hypothetical protein